MLSLMDERQLRHSLALWTMKNSRFAPQPGSCEEAAFIKTYAVPQTDLSESIPRLFKRQTALDIPHRYTPRRLAVAQRAGMRAGLSQGS